jgi:hypothetical protein
MFPISCTCGWRVDRVFATGESFRVEDAVPVGDRLIHSESQVSPIRDARARCSRSASSIATSPSVNAGRR